MNDQLIYAKVFGNPVVHINNMKISFPFSKSEALFYYLLIVKETTRNELVSLLWGDIDEETAKKNLRNAMYKVRKVFDADIIISPQKSKVILNPDIKIKSDIDNFISNDEKSIEYYSGDFLQGFLVKDGNGFMEWASTMAEHYRQLYIYKLYLEADGALKIKDYIRAEQYLKLIVAKDGFDEQAYRRLMKLYIAIGAYNRGIDIYNKLMDTLDKELGIKPEKQTTEVYNQIIASRVSNQPNDSCNNITGEFFYGREGQIQELRDNHLKFVNGQGSTSVFLVGEAGIGKTTLKDRFLKDIKAKEIYLLQGNCYQDEGQYFLKPWNTILDQVSNIIEAQNIDIPNLWINLVTHLFPNFLPQNSSIASIYVEKIDSFKFDIVEQALVGMLKKLSQHRKTIIVFEDIHWMDKTSLALLSTILLHNNNPNIMLIATMRNEYHRELEKFVGLMQGAEKANIIQLPRFNRKEVNEFIQGFLPRQNLDHGLKEKIYLETEGNAFFLAETLNIWREEGRLDLSSERINNVIKSRFFDISEEGKKLLNIISLFFDQAPLEMIQKITSRDEGDIIDLLEQLQKKYIIAETKEEGVSYRFTHQKLREHIYSDLSMARKRLLHGKVASILEQSLNNTKKDTLIYSKLIYHFTNGGDRLKALRYRIKDISIYLDFSHELFPVLNDTSPGEGYNVSLDRQQALEQLENIEQMLEIVKVDYGDNEQVLSLEIAFLHMKGRYLIREGEYIAGVQAIKLMISKAEQLKDWDYILKGYRQLIYYCIQSNDIKSMESYIEFSLAIASDNSLHKEMAILFRLKGLNQIMLRNYQEGKQLLDKSIEIFQSLEGYQNRYSLNIAASYNYIGEIYKHTKDYPRAVEYYHRAMEICENNHIFRGMTVFNTNAGQAYYHMGDYKKSKEHIQKALDIYNNLDSLWGRSTAEGYMALLLAKEKKYREAKASLARAEIYCNKLKSPSEVEILQEIKNALREI